MTIKRFAYKLHLWLGLLSGLIVFIVCLTGAIWALAINGWVKTDSPTEIIVPSQASPVLSPSEITAQVQDSLLGHSPNYITYSHAAPTRIGTYGKDYNIALSVNPYTGEIYSATDYLQNNKGDKGFDFWSFIGTGHRSLWLPWNIGRPLVNYGTLIFAITLLTGLIIWFPKSKRAAKNRFWFNWKKNSSTNRKIMDLHSVLGFYICFFLLAIAFTGMVWGIEWWSKGLYKVTTGGKDLPERQAVQSDTLKIDSLMTPELAVDCVFTKLMGENPQAYGLRISYPDSANKASTVQATVYKSKDTYYNADYYTFDRYSLQEIKSAGPYNGKYADASPGDKLRRMNYEIHVGSILGTPGRVLAFLAALFGASLPVTGAYIFIKRTRKKKKKKSRTPDLQ